MPKAEKIFVPRAPEFFGDQAPINSFLTWPASTGNGKGVYVPSVRYFKISDDESPRPQDRAYFAFNYFSSLDGPANQAAGGGIQHIRTFTATFLRRVP